MSTTWSTFLFETANFVLLAAVLGKLFFRPVRDALERRRSELEGERGAAADARADAERALGEVHAQQSEFEHSLEELRERTLREAEGERERLIERARGQMQGEREILKEELASLRRSQARSMARDAAFAAKEIMLRLFRGMQGPDLDEMLRGAATRELERLRATSSRSSSTGPSGSLAPVVVESATPLEPLALAALVEAAGVRAAQVRSRVTPELVAGVRILTARGLVDASAAGIAAQAESVLMNRIEQEGAGDG